MTKKRYDIFEGRLNTTIENLKANPDNYNIDDFLKLVEEIALLNEKDYWKSQDDLPKEKGEQFYKEKSTMLALACQILAYDFATMSNKIKHLKHIIDI